MKALDIKTDEEVIVFWWNPAKPVCPFGKIVISQNPDTGKFSYMLITEKTSTVIPASTWLILHKSGLVSFCSAPAYKKHYKNIQQLTLPFLSLQTRGCVG